MESMLQVVTSIRTPLALAALGFFGVFLLLREVIKGKVLPKLSERSWVMLLKRAMLFVFILLVSLVILGVAGYFFGPEEPGSSPAKSKTQASDATAITRGETACRWVWVFLGRYSGAQDRYEVPEAFEYADKASLRSPIPRAGDSILIVSQRSQIVTGYRDADPADKCARILEPPATYRPEYASSFEAGVIPAGKIVTVNKVELLPSPEAEPKYVWALVGSSR